MNEPMTCPHRPACSGCPSLEVAYPQQLEEKLQTVRHWFAEASIRDFEPRTIRSILPAPQRPAYRNRIKLVPRRTAGGEIHLGLYQAGSHRVLNIPGCPVQLDGINKVVEIVREAIHSSEMSIYDEQRLAGDVRYITIREGQRTGQVLVGLITHREMCPGMDRFCESIQREGAGIVGIVQHVNEQSGNAIFGGRNITRLGREYMEEEVAGLRIRLGLSSFFQVNTAVAEAAYRSIVDRLHLDRRETLLDLYSGVGTIAMVAAPSAYQAIGIEVVEEAVEFARDSAGANGIGNCTFRVGSVERLLPGVVRDIGRSGVTAGRVLVAVNPPRKGLDPGVLGQLVRMRPGRMAYLSCEPRTLVRDLKHLCDHDLVVRHVELFDMFPYTSKVETLAILERRRPMIAVPAHERARRREGGGRVRR